MGLFLNRNSKIQLRNINLLEVIITMKSKAKIADRYICLECSYTYDPAKGDPKQGIEPGTPFENLPQTWRCPECKNYVTKHGLFKKLEQQHAVQSKKMKK